MIVAGYNKQRTPLVESYIKQRRDRHDEIALRQRDCDEPSAPLSPKAMFRRMRRAFTTTSRRTA